MCFYQILFLVKKFKDEIWSERNEQDMLDFSNKSNSTDLHPLKGTLRKFGNSITKRLQQSVLLLGEEKELHYKRPGVKYFSEQPFSTGPLNSCF